MMQQCTLEKLELEGETQQPKKQQIAKPLVRTASPLAYVGLGLSVFTIALLILIFLPSAKPKPEDAWLKYVLFAEFGIPGLFAIWYGLRTRLVITNEGLEWRTLWGSGQGKWEDVTDAYRTPARPTLSGHLVFRGGQRVSLQSFGDKAFAPTIPSLNAHIEQSVSLSDAKVWRHFWQHKGIRPHENWSYTFHSRLRAVRIFGVLLSGALTLLLLCVLYQLIKLMGADGTAGWTSADWLPFLMPFGASIIFSLLVGVFFWRSTNLFVPYKDDKITVTPKNITWTNGKEAITATWEEITHCQLRHKECHLTLQGTEERVIKFPETGTMLQWGLFRNFYPLSFIIRQYVHLPESEMWQEAGEEALAPAVARSTYPIAGAQIFPYYTRTNRAMIGVVFLMSSVVSWVFIMAISQYMTQQKEMYVSAWMLLALPIGLAVWGRLYYLYRGSQVEADDLGIALVGPKGVVWRIPWLSIIKVERTSGDYTKIHTRDGKKYAFFNMTARGKELQTIIEQHVKEKLT
jgi:hypothetical protein